MATEVEKPAYDKREWNGKLFLIVGPSGSGKGTVIHELHKKFGGFLYPISYTTREMRDGEKPDDVYHFITKEKFEEMIKNDEFLEYAVVHSNNYYGTPKKDILDPVKNGAVVVREVDIQGFHSIRKLIPKENLTSVFMTVSNIQDLRGRIKRRAEISDEELDQRLKDALAEMAQAKECDYQVENEWGKIGKCVNSVERIILAELDDWY